MIPARDRTWLEFACADGRVVRAQRHLGHYRIEVSHGTTVHRTILVRSADDAHRVAYREAWGPR